ncbi:aromatic aminotransferase ISS1 [Phoenix dactylifera]|uniref:Aromatic aminotransferase ISS1 n=1 Tax=Phoenix dactylifera TaxID=42345 RepID=A0A8B9AJA9_PHODC|nr:aromatic aminotransferase ISS1 [Phoenix dactylifera]XP_038986416.1 aromatic aminotransferase ISS1 [Phoenix dactylifera]XP_038986417.1 aromatic aminotransferase ISS1 [Phoenix dactylifera]XP_038986418.1 aromatic aminotransferase ISS1 [Phoenix dactylifera]XP_038986419.1 aromatic aminotransferase ISS1 [Phoenix dactylifera]XP_038986420.1 aromatic aminotransferase ISS1 [Phoenix dactylifera]XP_038986421.1 aromatic aminotransferase ISS1 [Phoenix dactylifera]
MGSYAKLARRALETDTPVMVHIQELIRKAKDPISLAQGVVYWQPPAQALDRVKDIVWEPSTSRYGADEGLPELRHALIEKLRRENKLNKSSVMVTAGANQAFVNIVLTLCDPGDSVVMFAPYYFNAYMSFQMTGITNILVGPSNPKTLQPEVDWLEKTLSGEGNKQIPKLVTVVNPGNPSGVYIPEPLLKRISDLCKSAGAWLVVDNTYEYFMYDGLKHSCIEGNHIVNLFSFSKAYGMMGWRVGYIAYPTEVEGFGAQLLKVQDNIPICASIIGQHLARHSLEVGPEWIRERVQKLVKNREVLVKALAPLGKDAVKGGEGAIYLWVKLPDKFSDDYEVVRWLVNRHGVVVIPGSSSGGPGNIRISFGGLNEADCEVAAERLRRGLEELVRDGMVR